MKKEKTSFNNTLWCKCGGILKIATYKNGAKWLECEKCNTAVKPLNAIAKNN